MITNGAWHPYNNMFQHSPQATNPIFMSNEWIEEQKRSTETMLERRGVPPSTWKYYLEAPGDWDTGDMDSTGVHRGVKAILMSQRSVNPWWILESTVDKKVMIQKNFRRVIQALEEVDRFTNESMPDDSQLNAEYN